MLLRGEVITVVLGLLCMVNVQAQVTISADFSSSADQRAPLHEIWDVANRISPRRGSNVRQGTDINLIRMVGGIVKKVDGKKVPDLDFDPCRYDSAKNVYVYDWEPLIARLRKIVNSSTKIHQLVLDQPPWAFQYGYEFIPEGIMDSVHFREDERVSTYGNSLPPKDKEAYFDFIQAMMIQLVEVFGKEEVMSWRFRVGSEIETPDHWFGSKQDFLEHFANTERAVRSVLPEAQVGVHTRTPDFVFRNAEHRNYKGEVVASFAKDLIAYCHDHGVKYDFWGLSDYVKINSASDRDIYSKYDGYLEVLRGHPQWNDEATIDVMEYSTIISMRADGRGFLNCATTHTDLMELQLSHMFYRQGMGKIFRWGVRKGTDPDDGAIADLRAMVGRIRYESTITGSPRTRSNQLDAIFATNEAGDEWDVLAYSYNIQSLDYVGDEPVKITLATDFPVGTRLRYRHNSLGIEQNKFQQFLAKEGKQWLKSEVDEKGDPSRVLTDEGLAKYEAFQGAQPVTFSGWKQVVTVPRIDKERGSMVIIEDQIGSFAYKRYEVRQ